MPHEPLSLDDLLSIEPLLSDEERLIRDTVRRFVRERYLPRAGELFAKEEFAADLVPDIAAMGLLGGTLTGYGCAGMSSVEYGLAIQELEYGDSGLRSFVSVQGSLAMWPIWKYGSEEQKQRFLPKMASAELIGCFGLTEPDSGSDPGSMKTRAKKDGGDYVLSGTKMWMHERARLRPRRRVGQGRRRRRELRPRLRRRARDEGLRDADDPRQIEPPREPRPASSC